MKKKYITLALLPFVLVSCGRGGNGASPLPAGAKEANKEQATAAMNEISEELSKATAVGITMKKGSFNVDYTLTQAFSGVSVDAGMHISVTDVNFNLGIKNLDKTADQLEGSVTLSFKADVSAIGASNATSDAFAINGEASAAAYFRNNTVYVDYSSAATKALVNQVAAYIGAEIDPTLPDKFKVSNVFKEGETIEDAKDEASDSVNIPQINPNINVQFENAGDYAKFYVYPTGAVGAEMNLDSNTLTAMCNASNQGENNASDSLPDSNFGFLAKADATTSAEVRTFNLAAYLDQTSGFVSGDMDFTLSQSVATEINGFAGTATSTLDVKEKFRMDLVTGDKVIVDVPVDSDFTELETK